MAVALRELKHSGESSIKNNCHKVRRYLKDMHEKVIFRPRPEEGVGSS